jgi:hypothetical protein
MFNIWRLNRLLVKFLHKLTEAFREVTKGFLGRKISKN